MTIYMAETDKSQQGIPRLYDPGYLDKKSCPSGLTSPKNSWLWAAMASNWVVCRLRSHAAFSFCSAIAVINLTAIPSAKCSLASTVGQGWTPCCDGTMLTICIFETALPCSAADRRDAVIFFITQLLAAPQKGPIRGIGDIAESLSDEIAPSLPPSWKMGAIIIFLYGG